MTKRKSVHPANYGLMTSKLLREIRAGIRARNLERKRVNRIRYPNELRLDSASGEWVLMEPSEYPVFTDDYDRYNLEDDRI